MYAASCILLLSTTFILSGMWCEHLCSSCQWVSRTSLFLGITFLLLGGKYYTHINGVNSPNAIMLYGEMLKELGVPVEIATTQAHVPSFMVGKSSICWPPLIVAWVPGEVGLLPSDEARGRGEGGGGSSRGGGS